MKFYRELDRILGTGEKVVLSTIVDTRGSSPQTPGASALFSARGLVFGTVGGGTIEARAQEMALECLKQGHSTLTINRMMGRHTDSEESICGGEAVVLTDSHPEQHRNAFCMLVKSMDKRQAGILKTGISRSRGDCVTIEREWIPGARIAEGEDRLRSVFSGEKPLLVRDESDQRMTYLEPVYPRYPLLIAGAGHIGQALAHLGILLEFEVVVVDDREEFANRDRLPGADRIVVGNIADFFEQRQITKDDFIVIVTRGHRHDASALRACIKSGAAYIGMIGSKNKVAIMRRDFLRNEWSTEQEFDRVRTPIGLDIGSKTVQEIAVSIAAEIVRERGMIKKNESL